MKNRQSIPAAQPELKNLLSLLSLDKLLHIQKMNATIAQKNNISFITISVYPKLVDRVRYFVVTFVTDCNIGVCNLNFLMTVIRK